MEEANRIDRYYEKGMNIAAKLFPVCVALLPVLCLLNVPVLNISLGTVLLLVFLPYSAQHIWNRYKKDGLQRETVAYFIPFLAFYVYMILRADGSITRIVLCVATLVHLCAMFCGTIQAKKLREVVEWYAVVNSVLVLLQTLAFYLLNFRIQYIPQVLIHEQFQSSYVFREAEGLFRPSALFLEPSHFAQFCCFALISALFPLQGKADLKKAAFIGLGCILTTSGMGIVLTFGIVLWYLYAQFVLTGKMKALKTQEIVKWVAIFIVAVFAICQVPLVKTALQRVFFTVDGYNAIYGRLGLWKLEDAIGTMDFVSLLFGYGNNAEYSYYLTGLADTIYKFGLIGAALEIGCFGYLMWKKKTHFVWCTCAVFLMLFCVAHLTSFFAQVFYFGLVIADVMNAASEKAADSHSEKKEQRILLTNSEIKEIGYKILLDVADFCDENGIQYYLVCGTALGAARHGGFIPWDDDVDIGMPRPDYERFVEMYRSEAYTVCDTRFDKQYPYAFAKVCDRNTCLVENIENPCELGVYIDIFPIDGLPDDERMRKRHLKLIEWDLRVLAWKRISKDKDVGKLHKVVQVIAKTALYFVPVSVLVRKLEYDAKKYPYENSCYVGHFVTKAIWGSDVKPKEFFDDPIRHKFEDKEFWVPGKFDEYLTLEYGDYMKLPPKEKQVAKHDFVAYYK